MGKLQKNTEYNELVEKIGYVYDKAKSNNQ